MITTINASMQNRPDTNLELSQEEKDHLLEHFPDGVCAFDLEMTGLSPLFDKIIEIAAIKLTSSGNVEHFHSLINPLITIPEHTIQYHGLTNDHLKDAPTLKKPFKEFVDFYGNLPLVAHNAQFDAGFLVRGLHEYNIEPSLSDIYDSCRTARTLYKKEPKPPKSFKLNELAEYYEIVFEHHRALDDAVVCLKVFSQSIKYMQNKAPNENLKNIGFMYKLNSFRKSAEYILPSKFLKLREYVAVQKPIYIKYKGGSLKGKYRPIKPISLLTHPQGLVLYAECLASKMNKYFKIKKLQSISLEDPTL